MRRRQVLAVAFTPQQVDRIAPMLEGAQLELHSVDIGETASSLVETSFLDLILVALPLPDMGTQTLLDAIRTQDATSRRAGVLLITNPEDLESAEPFVDRGANRVVGWDWSDARIWQAIADLMDIAPRIWVKTLVELLNESDDDAQRSIYRTGNISATGMLIQDAAVLAPGNQFSFFFALPDRGQTVHGQAEVVRRTNPKRGEIPGVGARFLSFRGEDHKLLRSFIDRRLASTDKISQQN